MTAHRKTSPVSLHWVPAAEPEQRWQLRILRDFDHPKQLKAANQAWEDLSAFTDLLECPAFDAEIPETWHVTLVLNHASVWKVKKKAQTELIATMNKYLTVDERLVEEVKVWWEKKPTRKHAELPWEVWFGLLVAFRQEHPERWPVARETYRGKKIGSWCNNQRTKENNGTLPKDRRTRLEAIGFQWNPMEERRDEILALLAIYRKEHPDRWPKQGEIYREKRIGQKCASVRKEKRLGKLSKQLEQQLDATGFPWNPAKERRDEMLTLLAAYREEYPDKWPSPEEIYCNEKLGKWCDSARSRRRRALLSKQLEQQLEDMGFPWELRCANLT